MVSLDSNSSTRYTGVHKVRARAYLVPGNMYLSILGIVFSVSDLNRARKPLLHDSHGRARGLLRRRRLLEDDVVFRCSVGPFAVAAVRSTHAVESARGRWAWDASKARFWGAHATATALAASFLSGEERVRARLVLPPPLLEDGSADPNVASIYPLRRWRWGKSADRLTRYSLTTVTLGTRVGCGSNFVWSKHSAHAFGAA